MNFIVDAQLPYLLCDFLNERGYDSIHTLNLPLKNATLDSAIILIAEKEERVVVTKDYDFLDEFIRVGKPEKLLIVSTGNINNKSLIDLFNRNFNQLVTLLKSNYVVEIDSQSLTVHY